MPLVIGKEILYPGAKNSGERLIKGTPNDLFGKKGSKARSSDGFSHKAGFRHTKIEDSPSIAKR